MCVFNLLVVNCTPCGRLPTYIQVAGNVELASVLDSRPTKEKLTCGRFITSQAIHVVS